MKIKNSSNITFTIGIIAGFLFWLLDAVIDVVFFSDEDNTIFKSIFAPEAHELYMRGIVLILFFITSLITRTLVIKQEKISLELEKHRNNLQGLVEMRTEQLEKLATIDDLTQIYNRRKLYELTGYEIERSLRYKHPLSVIMIDIDHFKQINDIHGHDIGDQTIQSLSNTISDIIRKTDIFGRVGGEEFMLVLPDTDLKAAKEFAERIRLCVENEKFNMVEHITISLGVTQCVEQDNIHPLFKRADSALYTAKNHGRNCVVSA